ncbi:hypothetical protein L9F63_020954, partial [Diploptera punctata]
VNYSRGNPAPNQGLYTEGFYNLETINNQTVCKHCEYRDKLVNRGVYEEVHGVAINGSNRRIDIIAFRPSSKI